MIKSAHLQSKVDLEVSSHSSRNRASLGLSEDSSDPRGSTSGKGSTHGSAPVVEKEHQKLQHADTMPIPKLKSFPSVDIDNVDGQDDN